MVNMNLIPSVHMYQPPIDEAYHLQHHQNESISTQGHARSPSLISAVSAESDDCSGLLNEHALHTRLTQYHPESSQEEDQVQYRNQARSLLFTDHSGNENEKATPQVSSEPLIPQPILLSEVPTSATALASKRSRREPTRYYSHVGWGPHVGYEWEIQGGHKRGHNTGLKIWNSWSNAKIEWRVGNRARVLKYYVGGPLFCVFALLIVIVIVGLIVYFTKWRGAF